MTPKNHFKNERADDEPTTTPRVESTIDIDAHESTDARGYLDHVEVRDTPVKLEDDSADVCCGVEVVLWIADNDNTYPHICLDGTSEIISTTGAHYWNMETFDDDSPPTYSLNAYGYTQVVLPAGTHTITVTNLSYSRTEHDRPEYTVTIETTLVGEPTE